VDITVALMSIALEFGDSSASICDVLPARKKPSLVLRKRHKEEGGERFVILFSKF